MILQHLDGCRCDGVKRVTGIGGGSSKKAPNEVYGKWDHFHPSNHADEEGNETVANWICEPGCPVARLDEQSGDLRARGNSGPSGGGGGMYGHGKTTNDFGAGDMGGASRFFKQVGDGGSE